MSALPIFDLDGTLIDSDAALNAPFVALGVDLDRVEFGLPLDVACARLGIEVDDYLAHYDTSLAAPFDGVPELLAQLRRWAVCSNKQRGSGLAELHRLGWDPEVALFADAFAGTKELGLVLDRLGVDAGGVVFVGDTEHDRRCALDVGCRFAVAGWNIRARDLDGDAFLRHPLDVLDLLA